MSKKIIIDCDPGHDDAIALLYALGSPLLHLHGITTVRGNQSIDKVTNNALSVLELAGANGVPVVVGADGPLLRDPLPDLGIHGETGMDGPALPRRTLEATPGRAAEWIVEQTLRSQPGEITLVAIGPLTNVALAARLEPRIVSRVRDIVVMGGGFHIGNRTPVAEFNFLSDPEAAQIVLSREWPVTVVGLDVTNRVLADAHIVERLRSVGTKKADFVLDLLVFYQQAYSSYKGLAGFEYPPVHDVCAVAAVGRPDLFQFVRTPVVVETAGKFTDGMAVADFRAPHGDECRTFVAREVDVKGVWNEIIASLN